MKLARRTLLGSAVAFGALAAFPGFAAEIDTSDLKKMTGDIVPIGREERMRRLARAQELMRQHGLSAVVVEPGSSLIYFTGVRWWRSERLTAAVIPVSGEPLIVTPFFERPSVQGARLVAPRSSAGRERRRGWTVRRAATTLGVWN